MKSPKPMTVAAILAAAAAAAFVLGAVLLGAGIMLPSKASGGGGLLSGISVNGGSDAPDDHGFEGGHPVGLFFMTRFWMATGSLEKSAWYFTEDGRVFVDPEEGFSDEALSAHEGRRGTVAVEGSTMTVTWSDGTKSSSDVERDKTAFNWDMGIFTPVEPFDDDGKLVGKWEGGNSVSVGGGGGTTSRSLDLRDDGTFSGYSIASIRSSSKESSVSAGSGGTDSGRWKLDGYVLVMTYDDGQVARGIAFPYEDNRFYFRGVMYKRQ